MRQISPGVLGRRLYNQPLLGTVDGVNTTFTTAKPFLRINGHAEAVHLRGLRRSEGVGEDYEVDESGGPSTGYDTIEFLCPPRPGDILLIDYSPAGP